MPPNRQERRAAAAIARKNVNTGIDADANAAWEDLNDLRSQCHSLGCLPGRVIGLFSNGERLKEFSENQSQRLKNLMGRLEEQVKEFNNELRTISAKHEGKSGQPKNTDEFMEIFQIGTQYSDWIERYQGYVIPTMENISDLFDSDEQTQALEGELIQAKNIH